MKNKQASYQKDTVSNILTNFPKFKLPVKPKDDIDKAIKAFLTGNVGKFGKYVAVKNGLVYRTIITSDRGSTVELGQNLIAIRLDRETGPVFVGNSSVLPLVGRSVSFGNERLNRSRTEVQERLSSLIPMIPFSVFQEASLNLMNLNIIERGQEETVIRNETKYDSKTEKDIVTPVEVHYTGASLFSVDDKMFLFDIDRREVEHKIFNPFLVELPSRVTNIRDAYESLKPHEVVEAETKGTQVLRQGEWFFIKMSEKFDPKMREVRRFEADSKKKAGSLTPESLDLRAGNNRPNKCTMYHETPDGVKYVSGEVTHSGREHAPLQLKGWYLPVPNTSVQSFTLTGDVD